MATNGQVAVGHNVPSEAKELVISYSHDDDFNFVSRLKRDLEESGYSVWIDREDIPTGCDWPTAIATAINNCKGVVAILTNNYVKSDNCADEFHRARKFDKLLPVMREKIDYTGSKIGPGIQLGVGRINWVSFRKDEAGYQYKKSFVKLIAGVKIVIPPATGPVESTDSHPDDMHMGEEEQEALLQNPSAWPVGPVSLVETQTDNGSLTEANFLNEVGHIYAKWRFVGISLHISTDELNGFEKKHPTNLVKCFSEVFLAWERKNLPSAPFTWSGLVQALRRNFVGESKLAVELMQAHTIPGECLNPSVISDPPTLCEFMEHVAFHVQAKWHPLALMLNITTPLDRFEERYRGDQLACMEQVFEEWQKGTGTKPFKWSSIIEALQSKVVCNNALAAALQNKLHQPR